MYTPTILRFMLFDDGRVVDCMLLQGNQSRSTYLEHITHVSQFPVEILEKIAVLMVLDFNDRGLRGGDGNHVQGVGRRISEYTYWVDLEEDDGIYIGSENKEEGTRDPESG